MFDRSLKAHTATKQKLDSTAPTTTVVAVAVDQSWSWHSNPSVYMSTAGTAVEIQDWVVQSKPRPLFFA